MGLRMSVLFPRTLREDPAEAEVVSHRLLLRAGYVRRSSAGVFMWLPLGLRVLRRVEGVVREEMHRIGAQELLFPALLHREPLERSGRWTEYGDGIFRLRDRRGADYALGPTHEELFALLAKSEIGSYRDVPITMFQVQTKYRDEPRPRAGILRTREFLMKDSYSFDIDDAGLARSYRAHRDAYVRIFDRLGLDYAVVSAMSGAMGGSQSEEFHALSPVGEDAIVRCTNCDFAANVEAVRLDVAAEDAAPTWSPAHVVDTPGTAAIDALVDYLNGRDDLARPDRPWSAGDLLKNVLVVVTDTDGTTWPLAVGIPGDRALDVKRLEAQLAPSTVRMFEAVDFEHHPLLARGYIGPRTLGEGAATGIRYQVDPLVAKGVPWVSGADEEGKHEVGLVRGRDFEPDGEVDAAGLRDGDPCPRCGGALQLAHGIEIGHVFELGRKYTQAFDVTVMGADDQPVLLTMGSYGIGISRVVASIVEQHSDDKGILWPRGIGPADVHILVVGRDDAAFAAAEAMAVDLERAGLRTLLDDRTASPGVKFADAELIGIMDVVVVGKRLADGHVEIRDRETGTESVVCVNGVVDALRARHTS